jgi:CO dehydrogenase maturation factor
VKIAITGKGGSGKSTISGALCRHLAQAGHRVIAVDGDPNPNLGISLGVKREQVESMEPILNALIAVGHTHNDPTPDPEDLLERYGLDAPGGVRLVATGKIERPTDSCLCCGSHMTTRQFFGELRDDDRIVVADLEAGINDLLWAQPGPDDVVLVVAEPSAKSVEIARRAREVATELGVERIIGVANRCTGADDVARMTEAMGGTEVLTVPEDPAIEHADHLGQAAYDVDTGSPAVVAIAALAEHLAPRTAPQPLPAA